MLIIKV